MRALELRTIRAEETRPLRQRVLRPGQCLEELDYPGDAAPDTRHLGAYLDGELVGIASVYREPMPGADSQQAWRLRGMATLDPVRRTGVGQSLLEACIAHAAAHGATRLWCNARTPALEFYLALGFQTDGEEFELPEIGPHYRMWIDLGGIPS